MEKIFPSDTNFADGYVINIDKPLGWTSSDVVRKIKFALRKRGFKTIKVGHAGTLDPLATGVLLVCTGRATKRAEELQAGRKEYVADIMLGATTPSFDLEHPVDREYPYEHITRDMVERVLLELSGERLQVPPVYSAKKIEGQRAYEFAREGTEVEMRGVFIHIYSIEIMDFDLPLLRIKVNCGKGTYIRSLAGEIGEALGSGGHLVGLKRVRSGEYSVDDAYSVEEIVNFLTPMKQNPI